VAISKLPQALPTSSTPSTLPPQQPSSSSPSTTTNFNLITLSNYFLSLSLRTNWNYLNSGSKCLIYHMKNNGNVFATKQRIAAIWDELPPDVVTNNPWHLFRVVHQNLVKMTTTRRLCNVTGSSNSSINEKINEVFASSAKCPTTKYRFEWRYRSNIRCCCSVSSNSSINEKINEVLASSAKCSTTKYRFEWRYRLYWCQRLGNPKQLLH